MTVSQKIDMYELPSYLKQRAAALLEEAVKTGKNIDTLQIVVSNLGTDVTLIEAKNGR